MPDVNLTETKREYILNKIAEGVAHGLNSREISREIPKVTKAELISCISRLITD